MIGCQEIKVTCKTTTHSVLPSDTLGDPGALDLLSELELEGSGALRLLGFRDRACLSTESL